MDSSGLDVDIPDSGAIFAFGKNVPNRFYVKNDKIVSMDCGEGHAVMVTASGRVFGFGLNDYGQLGVGNKTTQVKPSVIKQLKDDGIKATKVACGPTHTLVLADDGIVYGFGNNSDGQVTGDESDFTLPVEIEQLDSVEVRELAAGRAFSLAVSRKGELLAWGGNAEGCLGQDDPDLPGSPDPLPIHLPARVTAAAAGSYHCACVLTDGRLFAWGETERGKLGIRNAEDSEYLFSPQAVPVPGHERVQMVSCGLQHTLVLTESGRVFACGSGESGQLGLGQACMYAPTLKPVVGLEKVKVAYVAAGERHSMCVCAKTGQVYAFGDTQHGKLGIKPSPPAGGGRSFSAASSSTACVFEPTLVTILKPVSAQQAVCGTLLSAVLAVPSKQPLASGKPRPGSSNSDDENNDQLPALRGRTSSLGRSNSFQQQDNAPLSTGSRGTGARVSGLAPLAVNGSGVGSSGAGRLDKSGRFSPLGIRGSTSPRYGSDTDAMKSTKKLDPIRRDPEPLGASARKARNSTATTKFDSLLNGPADSLDSSDDDRRLGSSRQRSSSGGPSSGKPPLSSARGRRGLAPLKLGGSDNDDDSDHRSSARRGKKPLSDRKDSDKADKDKARGKGRRRSDSPQPALGAAGGSRRRIGGRLPSIGAKGPSDEDEDSDDNNGGRKSERNRGRKGEESGEKSNGDSGVTSGVGCGGRRRGGEDGGGEGKARSCQLL